MSLGNCNDTIINHLNSRHLSRKTLTEHKLILARVGMSELPVSKLSETMICPRHRKKLGKYRLQEAEEYASLTDEQMLEKASVAVQSEIGVKHPVMYNVYNLCEMAFENRLSFFKVKMLREMCKHFEIPSNLVEDCSCMKESNYAMKVSNNYFGKLKFHNFDHIFDGLDYLDFGLPKVV